MALDPLHHWIVPGATEDEFSGLLTGHDTEADRYILARVANTGLTPLALVIDETKAERFAELMNGLFAQPGLSRTGGKTIQETQQLKVPGVTFSGFQLERTPNGETIPDTTKPPVVMRVLPHRNGESVALLDQDAPNEDKVMAIFLDLDKADKFIGSMDAMIEYTSERWEVED